VMRARTRRAERAAETRDPLTHAHTERRETMKNVNAYRHG
jgi:hypothetical protein